MFLHSQCPSEDGTKDDCLYSGEEHVNVLTFTMSERVLNKGYTYPLLNSLFFFLQDVLT